MGDSDVRSRSSKTKHAAWWLVTVSLVACDRHETPAPGAEPASSPVAEAGASQAPSASSAPPREALRFETVKVPGDLPAFVLRGASGSRRIVFLQGYCCHALGYVQSFQHAAARHGTLVAVQADKPCDDPSMRRWTNTPSQLDARVENAFRASGDTTPLEDLAVVGYSEGAVLAEMLAHRNPTRYAHVVLVGGPQKPVEWRLRKTRSTVMIAGSKDRQDLMKTGARDLNASGIPSTFLILPGAKHGQMGSESERVMGEALDWLWENARSVR